MKDRNSFRGKGINDAFAEKFKASKFYTEIYNKHKDEVIIGIRDGYICLYYNCDCISKIEIDNSKDKIVGIINGYYIGTDKKEIRIPEDKVVANYPLIKSQSDKREKSEKQAQQKLYMQNNNNPNSKWFCIDVEFEKSLKGKEQVEPWRFDLIAVSKSRPHKVALIELKYGKKAIGGDSGIRTHIKDFYAFHQGDIEGGFGFSELKEEIVSIINALDKVGVSIPSELNGITEKDIDPKPGFYFVTLDNNSCDNESTPKQTMSGYLFSDHRWGCKRISTLVNKEGDYYQLTKNDKDFSPVFLFSKEKLPNIGIKDILEDERYEIEHV